MSVFVVSSWCCRRKLMCMQTKDRSAQPFNRREEQLVVQSRMSFWRLQAIHRQDELGTWEANLQGESVKSRFKALADNSGQMYCSETQRRLEARWSVYTAIQRKACHEWFHPLLCNVRKKLIGNTRAAPKSECWIEFPGIVDTSGDIINSLYVLYW